MVVVVRDSIRVHVGNHGDYVEWREHEGPRPWLAVVAGKVLRKADGFGRRFEKMDAAVECIRDWHSCYGPVEFQ